MKKSIIMMTILLSFMSLYSQVEVQPLEINSQGDDFAPMLTEGGKTLFFTSARGRGAQKIYSAEKTSNGFKSIREIDGDVNDGSNIGYSSLTPDGQYMIFAAIDHSSKGEGRTDLYSAKKVKGKWTDIQNLGPNINSEYWDSEPTLSSDGRVLYFASDRPGGSGGIDIYVSEKVGDTWKKARPVTELNSAADDATPILSADNKTFTLSSNREGGYGNFDIYFSKLNNGKFTKPVNAGEIINTMDDDLFYIPLQNTNVAYFCTNHKSANGDLDIYQAVPNPHPADAVVFVGGKVYDANTNDPLKAKIEVTELKSGKKVANFESDDETGNYYVVLQPGKNYLITAKADAYMFLSEKFEIPANAKGSEITKDLVLSKNNTFLRVNFDFNKSDLQEESYPDLDNAAEYLKGNSEINVIIEGHTDDVGTDSFNDKLSSERAKSVKEYLIKSGIETIRIKTIGYGEKKPLIKETTEEARAINRRVEMKIDK
jgi:outer membrane protein OmpA-like peptidoglycan-associated protein